MSKIQCDKITSRDLEGYWYNGVKGEKSYLGYRKSCHLEIFTSLSHTYIYIHTLPHIYTHTYT